VRDWVLGGTGTGCSDWFVSVGFSGGYRSHELIGCFYPCVQLFSCGDIYSTDFKTLAIFISIHIRKTTSIYIRTPSTKLCTV
jgi:hypothetical protein